MKSLLVASAVSAALLTGAAGAFAQATAQPPAQPPAQPAPAPAAVAAPQFPAGAKLGYINIQRVASESVEGRSAASRVKAVNDKKVAELNDKNKALQANQDKLQKTGSVMSDVARAQLEKEIERQQVEIQRFTQDAQAEVQEVQNELQTDFQRKLVPVIDAVAKEKGVHMVFSQVDSGLVWADPNLDITGEVIKRFDAATQGAAKPPAAK
jgi:outer membrane protein